MLKVSFEMDECVAVSVCVCVDRTQQLNDSVDSYHL